MTNIDERAAGRSTDDGFIENGTAYQRLLDTDTHPVPDILREESYEKYEDQNFVPVSRYISRKYHELERDRMWYKVWQMACREEEIPEPGDTLVYEICEKSILIVRGKDMGIRAFYNSCLHRGRTLREEDGPAGNEIRCPFHGFAWNFDGSLKSMTCAWDFPQVDQGKMDLPQVKVDTWGGFVFINMDPASESLASFLGDLGKHFEAWPLEDRYIQAHVAQVIQANWKIAQEAFSEAFHVITTHPQRVVGTGDSNSQYDSWGNFNRGITANGVPSPHIKFVPSEQEMFDSMVDARIDEDPMVTLPEGVTAREMSGMLAREGLRDIIGDVKADNMSDAESLDSIYYTVFPNFHPWGAYQRIVYRFRPNGDDHETSIMDVYLLGPFKGARPKPAKTQWLEPDQSWIEATVLGSSARVFDQDAYNMPKVHKGLKSAQSKHLPLARYQEVKIRHIHHLLSQWIGEDVD